MRHVAIPLLCAAGLLLAVGLFAHRQSINQAPTPEPQSDFQDRIARLETELALSRARLEHVEAKQVAPIAVSAPTPASLPETSGSESTKRAVRLREELEQEFATRIRSAGTEARDEAWAKQEEEQIGTAAIRAAGGMESFSLENLSCRTSICTMDVHGPTDEAMGAFQMRFPHEIPQNGIRGLHFLPMDGVPEGTHSVAIAVFRSGYPMPGAGDDSVSSGAGH